MSSPDKKVSETELVAPNRSKVQMVKIRAKHPIRITNEKGFEDLVQPGQVVEVTEDEAKEFCDRDFHLGHRDAFGNLNEANRPVIVRRAEKA